ncbi:hypothetical protein CC85DRAFT_43120 [Cutaneotrichosporon oleaginosum]|uniref:Uncharacterized protein n=1 Tax=Cutaneotrichosporon oleaginosum TaxID=879819 RepID=A0A0J1B7M3_9TREE|nr:uncharacterized protein CC85DRAFT_43120 [Cutaneotrichosporon oleaginosum]KLT43754.1 hypothetical protein CC85DRAFT_43120 [Cutaneotrichosporon oleaginosum]TXT05171.1 hypothetical protein COLE_06491 [Cutaneotrichosporon oleaginosum]
MGELDSDYFASRHHFDKGFDSAFSSGDTPLSTAATINSAVCSIGDDGFPFPSPTPASYGLPSPVASPAFTPPIRLPAPGNTLAGMVHHRSRSRTLYGRPPDSLMATIAAAPKAPSNARPSLVRALSSPLRKNAAARSVRSLPPSPDSYASYQQYIHSPQSPLPLLGFHVEPDIQFTGPDITLRHLPFWAPTRHPTPRPVPIVPPPPGYREAPSSSSSTPRHHRDIDSARHRTPNVPSGSNLLDNTETVFDLKERILVVQYKPRSVVAKELSAYLHQRMGDMSFESDDDRGVAIFCFINKPARLAKPQLYNYARVKRLSLTVTVLSDVVGPSTRKA